MVMQTTGRPCAIRWLAMAAARCVLPVPGGPAINRPFRPGSGAPGRGAGCRSCRHTCGPLRLARRLSSVSWKVSKVRRRKRSPMPGLADDAVDALPHFALGLGLARASLLGSLGGLFLLVGFHSLRAGHLSAP